MQMGLILSEHPTAASERRAEVAAASQYVRERRDGGPLPRHADLQAELLRQLRKGQPKALVDVPAWTDGLSRCRGTATVTEVVADLLTGDEAMSDLIGTLSRMSLAGNAEADALLVRWATRHANWHAGA